MKSLLLRAAAIFSPLFAAALLTAPAHAAPFGVSPPTPNQTFVNQEKTFYSDLTDGTAVIHHCNLSVDGISHGAMTVYTGSGGKSAYLATSISTAGSRIMRVTCYDAGESNSGYAQTTVTVFADSSAPSVGVFTLAPTAPVAGLSVNIQTYYDDTDFGSGLDTCSLYVDGAFISLMNLSGGSGSTAGTASRDHTFSAGGSYSVKVNCTDRSENLGTRTQIVSVTTPPDTTAPTVGQIAGITPTQNVATTISATYSDNVGVTSCKLFVNDFDWGTMNLSGSLSGTASKSFAFNPSGTHYVYVACFDAAGNDTIGATRTVTVNPPSGADTTAPTVGQIAGITPTQNVATTISATYSDNVGVTSCKLFVNDFDWGTMNLSGSLSGTASKSFAFNPSGTHYVYVACFDAAGNDTIGATRTVTVNPPAGTDTTAPVIGTVLPSSATQNATTNIVVEVTDNVGVSSCTLTVNGVLAGAMSVAGIPSGSTAERLHSFTVSGNNTIRIDCQDAAGNVGTRTTTVSVTGSSSPTPYTNRLVKLACPAGFIDVNHPCKAVYYVGSDGKRHAFPNERVYFTWYSNFGGIIELDGGTLATITLGSNVNYRPGMRMVKFTTVNRVYAVARYGTLRWVTSEAAATALYGSAWNTRIDDLSDAFFTDYTFGADITSASSFNPTVEAATVSNIDTNLR
ncbi:MAG: hypothetical protein AAB668_03990 [Patescibacteria group bacterium]